MAAQLPSCLHNRQRPRLLDFYFLLVGIIPLPSAQVGYEVSDRNPRRALGAARTGYGVIEIRSSSFSASSG